MAYIIETPNPFEPFRNVQKHEHPGGISIYEWLEIRFPGFTEFEVPTICTLNGQPVLRKDWGNSFKSDDIICFVSFPGFTLIVVLLVVAVVAMAIVTALQKNNQPITPGGTPASAPVYSTAGQNNTIRLGEPIEVCYGRNRIYPSLAGRPYFEYIDNDQFQHALYCLGQGEYEIEAIQIGDTPIASFQEVEYEIITPGNDVTLFPTNVVTSVEAGGQTLFAPNQPEYVAPGWQGPFPTNPPTTLATTIAIDLVFPKGAYYLDTNGVLNSVSVILEIQYRQIDDVGAPLGVFLPIFTPSPYVFTGATTTPQRRTLSADVAPGRYEMRIRRTDTRILSYNEGSDTVWEGMRAWIQVTPDWGDVTLMAVRIRATNNLNNATESKFNLIATRKLPIRDTGGWTTPQTTRSIVWAFADIMRSRYGGRIISDTYFDWDALEALDALYTSRGDHFDWIFRDPITVWEGATAIGVVGRGIPLLIGSLLTLKRDGPLEIPVAMFTPDNILGGTFQWDVTLWDLDEYDSVEVEYTEASTGYLQETVVCTLPGGTADHPDQIRLAGCQDRTHAYREGLYMMASKRYLRENITFDTGMEGLIPGYGDLIVVCHDVPRWGQSGYVLQAVQESGTDIFQLFLSEPLRWEETGEYQILLRGSKGEVLGPFTAVKTTADDQVIVTIPDETSGPVDFLTGGTTEPMLFLFGPEGRVTKYGKVVKIEPKGGEAVTITAVNDAPIIHTFDDLVAPPLNQIAYPPAIPDLPIIAHLYLSQVGFGSQILQVAWTAAYGALSYIVQTSIDGVNWIDRAITVRPAIQLQSDMGLIYVRVAAINNGQGPWIQDSIALAVLIDIVTPFTALDFALNWSPVILADNYLIKVYDNTETEPHLKRTVTQSGRDFSYDYADAVLDGNLNRDILVVVDGLSNGVPLGVAGTVDLINPIPEAPSSIGYELAGETTNDVYRLFWDLPLDTDLEEVRVWLELTSGWDPAVTASYLTLGPAATETYITIPLESDGTHPDYYFRIGVFDIWGNERTTNISAEQVLSQSS